jgi:hypothetical protein
MIKSQLTKLFIFKKLYIIFIVLCFSCDPPNTPTPQSGGCLLLGAHDYECAQGPVDNLVRLGYGALKAHVRSASNPQFSQKVYLTRLEQPTPKVMGANNGSHSLIGNQFSYEVPYNREFSIELLYMEYENQAPTGETMGVRWGNLTFCFNPFLNNGSLGCRKWYATMPFNRGDPTNLCSFTSTISINKQTTPFVSRCSF